MESERCELQGQLLIFVSDYECGAYLARASANSVVSSPHVNVTPLLTVSAFSEEHLQAIAPQKYCSRKTMEA
jgi:hypothetical protein